VIRVLLAFCLSAPTLFASESIAWISELGGKLKRDGDGNIVTVDLRGTWIYDSQLIELARLPKLETLDLSHTRISDEGLSYLKSAPAIADLNLYYAEQITDQGLGAIREWKHLKRLNVRGTRVSDGALEIISHLQQLEALDIANTPTMDNGLDNLITLVNLKELSLGRRRESDNEVELLRLLPTLTYLDLSGPPNAQRPDTIDPATHESGAMRADLVRAIGDLKDLRVLKLGHSNIDADGLRMLRALPRVTRLGLEGCHKVNDEAAGELAKWASLKEIDLQDTKVTDLGLAALHRARPEVTILPSPR
jgi:Leucine-rich repeat (LRR) protein